MTVKFGELTDGLNADLTVKFGQLTDGLCASSHTQLTSIAGVLVDKVESLEERFRSFSANTELRFSGMEESPFAEASDCDDDDEDDVEDDDEDDAQSSSSHQSAHLSSSI